MDSFVTVTRTSEKDVQHRQIIMTIDGERRPLLQKQLSWLRTVYQYNDAGFPAHYCLSTAGSSSTTIIVGPIPSAYATYELYYFGNPTSVVTAGSTWLSVQFPEALLYGSLLEGYVYMKGEKDMRDTFQERFDRAMQSLKQSVDVQQLKRAARRGDQGRGRARRRAPARGSRSRSASPGP